MPHEKSKLRIERWYWDLTFRAHAKILNDCGWAGYHLAGIASGDGCLIEHTVSQAREWKWDLIYGQMRYFLTCPEGKTHFLHEIVHSCFWESLEYLALLRKYPFALPFWSRCSATTSLFSEHPRSAAERHNHLFYFEGPLIPSIDNVTVAPEIEQSLPPWPCIWHWRLDTQSRVVHIQR